MSMNLKQINFGACDAETEAAFESGSYVSSVYFDPFNTYENLERGKIVIAGKKGTGKSGLALQMQLNKSSDRFVKPLKYKHFELKQLVEMAGQQLDEMSRSSLWKWILLCTLLEALSEDNSLELSQQASHDLSLAVKRISGFVSLDGFKITEMLKKSKGTINLTAFKGLGTASKSTAFDTRETQASFFSLVSPFEKLLIDLFSLPRDEGGASFFLVDI